MNKAAIYLSCLIALIVMVAFPRDQWVLKNQISMAATGDFYPGVTKYLERDSAKLLRAQDPLFDVISLIHERQFDAAKQKLEKSDPENKNGYWTIAARYGCDGPRAGADHAKATAFVLACLDHADRRGATLYSQLLRTGIIEGSGRHAEAVALLKDTAGKVQAQAPGFLQYDNASEMERERADRAFEKIEGYRGQYARAAREFSLFYPDYAVVSAGLRSILKTSPDQTRHDLAIVASNLVRKSDAPIACFVGQGVLTQVVWPKNHVAKTPVTRQNAIAFAQALDKRTGEAGFYENIVRTSFLDLTKIGGDDVDGWGRPFYWGAIFVVGALGFLGAWLASWLVQPLVTTSDGFRAAIPHILTSAGWITALLVMGAGLDSLSVLALAHVGLAATVFEDRWARPATAFILLVGAVFAICLAEDRAMAIPLTLVLTPSAIMAFRMDVEKRRKWSMIAGWAVSIGCLPLAILQWASLVPTFIWVVSLFLMRKRNPLPGWAVFVVWTVAAALATVVFGLSLAGFPVASRIALALLVAIEISLLSINSTREKLQSALAVGCVLVALGYGGLVGWTIRHDKAGEAIVNNYIHEADSFRERSGIS